MSDLAPSSEELLHFIGELGRLAREIERLRTIIKADGDEFDRLRAALEKILDIENQDVLTDDRYEEACAIARAALTNKQKP